MTMTDLQIQPLDLSCPARYWRISPLKEMKMNCMKENYSKLSVSISRRYSNCSDNVSFSSDRSHSISPTSDRSSTIDRSNEGPREHSDSYLSPSDSDGDTGTPSPLSQGPATKRFLSKYIKEQVGKFRYDYKFFLKYEKETYLLNCCNVFKFNWCKNSYLIIYFISYSYFSLILNFFFIIIIIIEPVLLIFLFLLLSLLLFLFSYSSYFYD